MDEDLKRRLTSGDLWMRLLYMLFFWIAYAVAETVLMLVAVFQFLTILVTGSANEAALRFGASLSTYLYRILRFETFNSETRPFPFEDWPEPQDVGSRWLAETGGTAQDDAEDPLGGGGPIEDATPRSADDEPASRP